MNPHPHPHALDHAPLLLALGRAGIELAAHGDRLRHRPADLPPDLSARLRLHRAAVLGLLVAVGEAIHAEDSSGMDLDTMHTVCDTYT